MKVGTEGKLLLVDTPTRDNHLNPLHGSRMSPSINKFGVM